MEGDAVEVGDYLIYGDRSSSKICLAGALENSSDKYLTLRSAPSVVTE